MNFTGNVGFFLRWGQLLVVKPHDSSSGRAAAAFCPAGICLRMAAVTCHLPHCLADRTVASLLTYWPTILSVNRRDQHSAGPLLVKHLRLGSQSVTSTLMQLSCFLSTIWNLSLNNFFILFFCKVSENKHTNKIISLMFEELCEDNVKRHPIIFVTLKSNKIWLQILSHLAL